jgi:myo-inositol catabolism protein IolC
VREASHGGGICHEVGWNSNILQEREFSTVGSRANRAPRDRARISSAKELIYGGLLSAGPRLPEGARPGLLVDEEFGTPVLERAQGEDVIAAVAVERSGQKEFQFEYEDFGAHLERLRPELAKALVRYNAGGDRGLNDRQLERLKILSAYLSDSDTDFLLELLVPPTDEQLAEFGGDSARYDADLRPASSAPRSNRSRTPASRWRSGRSRASRRPRTASPSPPPAAAEAALPDCLILGRGADESKVEHWLTTAAPTPGFGGFAVGRTIWWDAIAADLAGATDRPTTVETIATRYLHFVDVYLAARTAPPA